VSSRRLGARELVDLALDEDSYTSWDAPPVTPVETTDEYAAELAAAGQRSGVDESITTGEGSIRGRRVGAVLREELPQVLRQPREPRLAARHDRYRKLGLPGPRPSHLGADDVS
jgi:acetyl-CoA carboxylase carboxyl transferase subunit beta